MDDHTRWLITAARDKAYDGAFVYGVRSTRIYCRPSCPSRRPRRNQVTFFAAPAAARRAGFRPCRRCRPDSYSDEDPRIARLERVCRYIEHNPDTTPTLAVLAAHVGVSPSYLQRSFKAALGITPRQYAETRRLDRFRQEVENGATVTRALYGAGFGSTSRLYEKARSQLGMTPATYRKGGLGAHIRYTTASCPLGRLLVAATEAGVCAVSLGDEDTDLAEALRAQYPRASISRDDQALRAWLDSIVAHLAGELQQLDLPLDILATAFQRRVWATLRKIPYGETRTYSEMAHALGSPAAARAVGRACATNPVSLLIPCHRAVRADGSLGGYRWGVERKRSLLQNERELRSSASQARTRRPGR
ncbi:MAG: bifunctional DNA-binding transcriptional regulator/O6-methylguanine-DNA methyltransferase Ada [Gemmatimonadota bacterium]|nr:MAG: bifunctional DNA-binding transcriptional regulator/O6-methylguanine-DNA methyltransferase Ada [Gemmatimonadota bacterium]